MGTLFPQFSYVAYYLISSAYEKKGKYTSATPLGNLWVGFFHSFSMECKNPALFPYLRKASKIPIGMEYIWASHSHSFPIQNSACMSIKTYTASITVSISYISQNWTPYQFHIMVWLDMGCYLLCQTHTFTLVRESIFYPSILVYVFFCDLYQLFLFGLCFTLVFYFWGGRECTQTRFNFSIACLCSQSYKKLVSPVQFRFQFSS